MTLDVWEVMRTASAVRRYRDEPVEDHVLERCLQAATWAPSGGNQQPWRFVVLRSAEARDVVTAAAPRAVSAKEATTRLEQFVAAVPGYVLAIARLDRSARTR